MKELVAGFADLFEGLGRAHGTFLTTGETRSDGKKEGRAATVCEPITLKLWEEHLDGTRRLGVPPVNDQGKLKWCNIDIDQYNVDLKALAISVRRSDLPFVVVRTKSGGCHAFLFFNEWVEASLVVPKLHEFSSFLGFADSEIFPKQTKVAVEQGQVGNWLNMPYFGHENTVQYGLNAEGSQLNAKEFLAFAMRYRMSKAQFLALIVPKEDEILPDGPPCLIALLRQGVRTGMRNEVLAEVCVYWKKRNVENWQLEVRKTHDKYFSDPLPDSEIQRTLISMDMKEYRYSCQKNPMKQHCNRSLCLTRACGVGDANSKTPLLRAMVKLETEPPMWYIEFLGLNGVMQGQTDDIFYLGKFRRKFFETYTKLFPTMKAEAWTETLRDWIKQCEVQPIDEKLLLRGRLQTCLEEFLNDFGETSFEDLLHGAAVKAEGKYFFRSADFTRHVERVSTSKPTAAIITSFLKKEGGVYVKRVVLDKRLWLWELPCPEGFNGKQAPFTIPKEIETLNF